MPSEVCLEWFIRAVQHGAGPAYYAVPAHSDQVWGELINGGDCHSEHR